MDELYGIILEAASSLYQRDIAVFAVSSLIIALLIWLLDLITAKVSGKSVIIGTGVGGIRYFQSFMLWGVGSGVAAYIGGISGLFNVTSMSAKIAVGVGWPTVLPRIIAMKESSEESEQEERENVEEEEEI
jgi:hypothetical protein